MSDETPLSNTQILVEIRAEREALEQSSRPHSGNLVAVAHGSVEQKRLQQRAHPVVVVPIKWWSFVASYTAAARPIAREAAERRLLYGVSLALDRLLDALSEHEHDGPMCALRVQPVVPRPQHAPSGYRVARPQRLWSGAQAPKPWTARKRYAYAEIRVNIIEPSEEQRARDEDSDREVAAAVAGRAQRVPPGA